MAKSIHSLHGVMAVLMMTLSAIPAFGWGDTGHNVTCEIASRHLTPKARKQISKILDGKTIVYWAKWMDNASHTPQYAYTSTWHYRNVDADEQYPGVLNPKGDVVTALEEQTAALKSGKLSKEEAALALKMVIHFCGDIHCPMHMAHKSDRGGNQWQIQFFGKGKNLHFVYDTGIIENGRHWSYTEWADQLDIRDKKAIAEIVKGDFNEWGRQTWTITTRIYDSTPKGSKLSYDYAQTWLPDVEQQLLKGGLRLASVLNDIFK